MHSRIAAILALSALCWPAFAEASPGGDFDLETVAVPGGPGWRPPKATGQSGVGDLADDRQPHQPQRSRERSSAGCHGDVFPPCCWIGRGGTSSPIRLPRLAMRKILIRCRPRWASARACPRVPGTRSPTSGIGGPLILVDSIDLRSARHEGRREVHLPPGPQPGHVGHPRSQASTPFSVRTQRLAFRPDQALFPFEKRAVELASRSSHPSRPSCRAKTRCAADPQQ